MFRPMVLVAVCGALVAGILRADEDATEKKLQAAKSEFDKTAEKARMALIDELKKKAEATQKAGDLKSLEKVEAEIKALEESGALPKSVPTKTYESDLRKAKAKLEDAYSVAVSAYTKAGQRAQAKATQQELEEFKKGGGAGQVGRDALQKGTVWKGERTFTKGAAAGQSVEFELNVTARSGKTFSGFTASHFVEGTIEDGKIEWKVIRQRNGTNPGQPHKGEVRGDTLVLTFEGMGAGGPNAGTAKLVLQKPK
jgi:hypothetical protein